MSEDGQPAVFVGTFLNSGDSVALCDTCLVAWSAAMLQAMTGVDPEPFLKAISEDEPDPNKTALPVDQAAPAPADTASDSAAISQEEPATRPNPRGRAGKAGRRADVTPGRTQNGSADPGTGDAPAGNGGTAIASNPPAAE